MQHIWLLSDLDGTLLPSDKQIPAENEDGFTIKYGEIRIYDNGNWS